MWVATVLKNTQSTPILIFTFSLEIIVMARNIQIWYRTKCWIRGAVRVQLNPNGAGWWVST